MKGHPYRRMGFPLLKLLTAVVIITMPNSLEAQTRAKADIYVAIYGADHWSGTLPAPNGEMTDGPFATLERARDAVREWIAKGLESPIEIVVRGGTYHRTQSLVLTPEDSGTEACPITWRAAKGERVVIRGGARITGWERWKGPVLRADLAAQGLDGVSFHQLFYKSAGAGAEDFAQRQILARYPNFDPAHPRTGGFLYTAGQGEKSDQQVLYHQGDLPFDRWQDISQAEVMAPYAKWLFAITPILGVDADDRMITVRPVRGKFGILNRFFVQNVLDALDSPGEWFLDRKQSVLYFYPPEDGGVKGEVIAPIIDNIIELRGTIPYPHGYLNISYKGTREDFPMPDDAPPMNPVENVVFRGFDFECARQDAIRMTGVRNSEVIGCSVTNVGGIGINLGGIASSFEEVGNPRVTPATGHPVGAGAGGQNLLANEPCVESRVAGCDVWSTGSEGIMLYGTANTSENNHVWDIGLYAKDAAALHLLGEKNVARRNLLHDCPRCAVFLKGIDNVVELNEIHHSILETTDMGAIRMVQRNLNLKGNVIRFNRITDTVGYGFGYAAIPTHYASPFLCWGIYLDDYTCGTLIHGNIIGNTGRGGINIHGGGENVVTNNVIADAGLYQIEFNPIAQRMPSGVNSEGAYVDAFAGNRAERNIIVCSEEGAMPYHFNRETKDNPTIRDNLVWFGTHEPIVGIERWLTIKGWDEWLALGMDQGSIVADPMLRDNLPVPDSPAWALGFEPIPVEQIGCYESPDRASWPPVPNQERFREKPILHAADGYLPPRTASSPMQFVGPVNEDFESYAVGRPPRASIALAVKPSRIGVTDEIASSGSQSLKFVAESNRPQAGQPRIYYPLNFSDGDFTFSVDLFLDGEAPPGINIDFRQYSNSGEEAYSGGPMLRIEPNGNLVAQAQNKILATLPFDKWFQIKVRFQLGEDAPDNSELSLIIQDQTTQNFVVPHINAEFQRLERISISSPAATRTVFYLDNLMIAPTKEK